MMNWAVGREYLDRTPFRRGTERLLAVAPPLLRSMLINALDTSRVTTKCCPAFCGGTGSAACAQGSTQLKCRVATARPEPVFKYFSNRTADRPSGNSIETRQGTIFELGLSRMPF